MSEANDAKRIRPRSKSLVALDLNNAYERLGISPLASTDEIRRFADLKRRESARKRRARSQQVYGAEEAEMTELQEIENLIGTVKNRAAYDRENPQNELLTVQPAPCDQWLDPRQRATMITAWLVEELGREVALPSPESLTLWASHGLSPEFVEFLEEFARVDGTLTSEEPSGQLNVEDKSFPSVTELRQLRTPELPNADSAQEEASTHV